VALVARTRVGPAARVEQESLLGAGRDFAQSGRHGRQKFESRRRQQTAQPELRNRRRGAREQQRARLGFGQSGQVGAVPVQQLVAAALATFTVDRHAGRAEVGQVAIDGPFRHLEFGRELGGREATVRLQVEQDGDEA
jgi:hypothetical protein